MKLSECKDYFAERINLLKINTINTYSIDLAYISQRWSNILSTTTFTISYLLLISVAYNNVDVVAGYTKNDSLFLSLVGQLNYYIMWVWGAGNVASMITDVNRGGLDLILTKPLPSLFYVSTRRIGLVGFFTQGMVTIIMIALFINWSVIYISPLNLFLGIIVFICGQLALNAFQFAFAIPVFWQGEATELSSLSLEFIGMPTQIPFEALYPSLKALFTTLIPVAISTVVCTSVLLNKSNPIPLTILSAGVALLAILFKSYLWRLAMRQYTSASS